MVSPAGVSGESSRGWARLAGAVHRAISASRFRKWGAFLFLVDSCYFSLYKEDYQQRKIENDVIRRTTDFG